ncbi:MAG: NADH-quinone oxidoreductase subunit N [Pirellulaceae bacterium]|nr:NADH-quinone oxidoreductase subunit N [Pirellulaceae bacterium]
MLADRNTVVLLLPELILVAMATWIYVGGTITRSRTWWVLFALATYLATGLILLRGNAAAAELFASGSLSGPLILDPLGQTGRVLALGLGLLFTLLLAKSASRELASETCATVMLLTVGLMLVCRANSLVLLFLSLELISIPTYVLLYLGRADRASAEAAAKYFFLSILSSAMLLYGLSFLYGLAGVTLITAGQSGTQVVGIREALAALAATPEAAGSNVLLLLGLVLTFGGLAFKIAAVPFQFYAPDVYQGTTNVNAGLLATVPKMAGVLAMTRLLVVAVPATFQYAWQVMLVVAILTMTIGNVSALWQHNVRRLLAYSSIAHAGYMLIGFAVALAAAGSEPAGAADGVAAVLLYLVVYVLAAVGVFAALSYLGSERGEVNDLEELSGLGRTRPEIALAISVFLFSMAGIPPLAGFWGKFELFAGAVRLSGRTDSTAWVWFLALAVLAALNAAIAAAYYLRVVGVMYFRPPAAEIRGSGQGPLTAMLVCAVLVVAAGLLPTPLAQTAANAGRGLVGQRVETPRAASIGQREPARPARLQ